MNFLHFDSSVRTNDFWNFPIARINQSLERNSMKDALQREGISAVYGCPLPENVRDNIRVLQKAIDRTLLAYGSAATVKWRSNIDALHFTVYGLVVPDDYVPGVSWPLPKERVEKIQEIVRCHGGFELQLQGAGILGMGAVSVRVSDSDRLEAMRDALGSIEGVSQERFGSRTKKIVLGRFTPFLTEKDREAIHLMCGALRSFNIGTLHINALEIIHYKNTLLDGEHERVRVA